MIDLKIAGLAATYLLASVTAGNPAGSQSLKNSDADVYSRVQPAVTRETSPAVSKGFHIAVDSLQKRESGSGLTRRMAFMPFQSSQSPVASTVGAQIAADMTGKNEGYPYGVPLSYAWASGPVVVMGNNSTGWKAMTMWGVVYPAAQGNPAVNTRVNIRNARAFFLTKGNGKWLLLQNTSTPAGASYRADFQTIAGVPGDVRTEPDGTISVTAIAGYNYHFYPSVRGAINPNDIGGIVTIFEARLIVANPALPDDRNIAAYLAGSGGDYYPALTGTWPGGLTFNPGIAIGKEKYVRTFWRSFAMTTIPATQLQKNPPPINLTGIQP